jgi:hypothetical protein
MKIGLKANINTNRSINYSKMPKKFAEKMLIFYGKCFRIVRGNQMNRYSVKGTYKFGVTLRTCL